MPIFHQKTKHSYMSVRKNANFLDWQSQPRNYKSYPHFYQRFSIEDYEELRDLNLMGAITFKKSYPNGEYYLRSVPSAGGLYPFELYLQLRGIKGLLDGLYHYEPYSASLVLLQEIGKDGVEAYFKDASKQKGIVFLISSVYFRSSWKYRDRAIRYILLDAGHQLGALVAAMELMGREYKIDFEFDKLALNEAFGFRDDEMFMCALTSATAQEQTQITPLRQKLPFVSGCDYLETTTFIEDAYKQSALYEDEPLWHVDFFKGMEYKLLREAIVQRRSIRAFYQKRMLKEEFEFILEGIFAFAEAHNIEIFYTTHLVDDVACGIYCNGELKKEGDFRSKSRYLALEQNLGGQSGVTFYFTSNEMQKYQKVNILSGFLAHVIYVKSEMKGIGCSGIGAYYDDECKEFLDTKNNILYLLAIGR